MKRWRTTAWLLILAGALCAAAGLGLPTAAEAAKVKVEVEVDTGGGGAEADEAMAYALLKVPDDEAVREVVELSLSNAGEGIYDVEIETHGWLYDLVGDWSFQASVVRDGDGFVLLFGGSGEDLARARAALGDDKERLKIARRSEHGNFVRLIDDPDGTLAKEIFDGLGFEPQWPGFLELSLGVEAGRIALALRHNLYEAAFGGAAKPGTAASLKDPGLKFGGVLPRERDWKTS